MSFIGYIKSFLVNYRINKSDKSKIDWLSSQGAVIGEGTRFIGEAYLGSEPYLVEIGKNCLISSHVCFLTHDGGVKVLNSAGFFDGTRMDKMARIKIGDNCFIGQDAKIMGGVQIGDNVIVGTCSVVTKNIPSGVVVAGMPARVICNIEEYFKKNLDRGLFFPTASMSPKEKKAYLTANVPKI